MKRLGGSFICFSLGAFLMGGLESLEQFVALSLLVTGAILISWAVVDLLP